MIFFFIQGYITSIFCDVLSHSLHVFIISRLVYVNPATSPFHISSLWPTFSSSGLSPLNHWVFELLLSAHPFLEHLVPSTCSVSELLTPDSTHSGSHSLSHIHQHPYWSLALRVYAHLYISGSSVTLCRVQQQSWTHICSSHKQWS